MGGYLMLKPNQCHAVTPEPRCAENRSSRLMSIVADILHLMLIPSDVHHYQCHPSHLPSSSVVGTVNHAPYRMLSITISISAHYQEQDVSTQITVL